MDRFDGNPTVAAGFAPTAAAIHAIGRAAGSLGLLVSAVLPAGTVMNTAQSSPPARAAAYPTQGRATGVGWMLGLGRFGGIAGSFPVAELARRQLHFGRIFTVVAVPGPVAAAALVVEQIADPESKAARGEAVGH